MHAVIGSYSNGECVNVFLEEVLALIRLSTVKSESICFSGEWSGNMFKMLLMFDGCLARKTKICYYNATKVAEEKCIMWH